MGYRGDFEGKVFDWEILGERKTATEGDEAGILEVFGGSF